MKYPVQSAHKGSSFAPQRHSLAYLIIFDEYMRDLSSLRSLHRDSFQTTRIATLVRIADDYIKDANTDANIREYLEIIRHRIQDVCADIDAVDHGSAPYIKEMMVSAMEVGFVLGSVAAQPTYVSKLFSQIQSERARKSAEVRRVKAERGWKAHALQLAIQVRGENPGISQANLAAEVRERWKECDIKRPEQDTLVPFIRGVEASGSLARRRKA